MPPLENARFIDALQMSQLIQDELSNFTSQRAQLAAMELHDVLLELNAQFNPSHPYYVVETHPVSNQRIAIKTTLKRLKQDRRALWDYCTSDNATPVSLGTDNAGLLGIDVVRIEYITKTGES